jgi:hypothetical protein
MSIVNETLGSETEAFGFLSETRPPRKCPRRDRLHPCCSDGSLCPSCYTEVKLSWCQQSCTGHFDVVAGDLCSLMSPHLVHRYRPDTSSLRNGQESGPEERSTNWCQRVNSKQQFSASLVIRLTPSLSVRPLQFRHSALTILLIPITSYFVGWWPLHHRLYLPSQLFDGHGIIWIYSGQSYCHEQQLWPSNVNEDAKMYDDVIVNLLDCILPARPVVRRPGHLAHGSTLIVDSSGRPRLLVRSEADTSVHLLSPPGSSGLLCNVPPTRDRSRRLLTACLVVGDVPATPSVLSDYFCTKVR